MDKYFYITLAILVFIHLIYYIKSKRKKYFITSIFILIGFTVFYFVKRDFFNDKNKIVMAMLISNFATIIYDILQSKKEKQSIAGQENSKKDN